MNIKEYKEAIKLCRNAGIPLMAHGPGGVGKTRGAEQAAKELELDFIPWQAPLFQPVDLLGLPDRQGNKTIWLRPEILPENGEGIILVDELPDCSLSMMKAYYQLILENKVQGHVIPKEWYILGAGNRPEDSRATQSMPAPLITRFCHIGVCCDVPDFSNDTPKTADIDEQDFIEYSLNNFHPLITAFLKFKPDYIYKHQATPRTWEYVSKFLYSTSNHFSFILSELIKGTVGSVGVEFNGFIKMATKIPSINAIIKDPMSVDIPSELQIVYATLTALIHKTGKDTVNNIITYVKRLSQEMQFFYFASVRNSVPEVLANANYINWMNINKDVLI